jgi:diguanylate cyclase (GGDEF)-like protein
VTTSADLITTFMHSYRLALEEFVKAGAGEEGLMNAYELGRQAVVEQLNILDLVATHQNIVMNTIAADASEQQRKIFLRRSEEFLEEVMAPFEMMHRGFDDAIRQLQEVNMRLEQRVEERTQALQDSQRRSADLARLYLILSNINSAIVRLRTREEIFREACRIAVNQGGYPVAGVTLRDPDVLVLPDSWFQLAHEGMSSVGVPLDSVNVEVRDALLEVYNTGKPVIRHKESEDNAICNGEVIGYSAYALLPLMLDGEVNGVFALFSAEPDSFIPDEMRLLLEMAGDLSFSLENIQKDKKLNYLANYDILTGLPNLNLLLERLPLQIQTAKRSGTMVALMLVDLVHFSDVNDTYGRHVGDDLLKQVSIRLRELSSTCETLARIGADRFALSFTHITETNQVAHVLERDILGVFSTAFQAESTDIHLSVQVGISLFPSDASDAAALYQNTEIALKGAKNKGEIYLLYDPTMNERIIRAVTMEAKLRLAIDRDQLVIHYQPKVSTEANRIVGMEALLRYADPEIGLVPPKSFIHLLEETGMIIEVGFWVIRRVMEDIRLWHRLNLNPPRVAVNVSPIQLEQKNFLDTLQRILQITAGRSYGLDIEITESAVMTEVQKNIPKLKALREMGFQIAIDDFGTGYSSLSYLSRLPVNALKIDRSFIVDMTEHPNNLAIVTAIISLAHSLRLEVVAEGVEQEEQAKLLRLLRCDLIQGNLYSPPLPAEQIIPLLRQGYLGNSDSIIL